MSDKTLAFLKAIGTVNAGVFNRDVLIRHAIALAVSDLSALPIAPVENLEIAFNNFARLNAEEHVAAFNEVSPINIGSTISLVRAYWIARYKAAFGVSRIFSGEDYLDTITGLASAISPEDLKILNEGMSDFSYLYGVCRQTVNELQTPVTKV